jgi:hypothetical protein
MPNGRCRMHGGKSTGPRTAEAIERISASSTRRVSCGLIHLGGRDVVPTAAIGEIDLDHVSKSLVCRSLWSNLTRCLPLSYVVPEKASRSIHKRPR